VRSLQPSGVNDPPPTPQSELYEPPAALLSPCFVNQLRIAGKVVDNLVGNLLEFSDVAVGIKCDISGNLVKFEVAKK